MRLMQTPVGELVVGEAVVGAAVGVAVGVAVGAAVGAATNQCTNPTHSVNIVRINHQSMHGPKGSAMLSPRHV